MTQREVNVNADAVNMMRSITMNVKVRRVGEMRVRIWIGTRLLRLVAWVLNCNVDIGEMDKS